MGMRILRSRAQRLQSLAWLSPASFLVLLLSISIVSVLPYENHRFAVAVLEGGEVLAGTLIAVVMFSAAVWTSIRTKTRFVSTNVTAISELVLWVLFWILAIATHGDGG
jgi:hypothetical protein